MWECNGELSGLDIDAAQEGQGGDMLGAQDDGLLQQAGGSRNITVLESRQRVVVQVVRLYPALILARLGIAKLQLSAPPLLLLRVRGQCSFLPLVFSTMGVPRKPNSLRI
jgi:hypothetical protein